MTALLAPPASPETVARQNAVYAACAKARKRRKDSRRTRPLVRLWNGDWQLRGIVGAEYSASFQWLLNEAGAGTIELPAEHYLAGWLMNPARRAGAEAVHVTCDKDGTRWSGRLQKVTHVTSPTGLGKVVAHFLDDIAETKFITVRSAPFLPEWIQFPRVFLLAAPSIFGLKVSLFVNLLRRANTDFALREDPIDAASMNGLDMSGWPIVVKPSSFADDTSLWSIIVSRWKTWFDLAAPILEDGQLMITYRRWLTGDPEPWKGAGPNAVRHGALVLDIVDRSGWFGESSEGGTAADGLKRTIFQFFADMTDGFRSDIDNPTEPPEYLLEQWMGTKPEAPWVTYRPGDQSGIQSSEFTHRPATAVQIACGGRSMPGVNEGLEATISMIGDAVAAAIVIPPVGGVLTALTRPLWSDVLLAWMAVYNAERARRLGWSHYWEFFQRGADRAYTLSSLIALRAGMWATRGYFTHRLTIADGAPYYIGENGHGHFFLGDRIGVTIPGDASGAIHVDQVHGLELAWRRGTAPAWQITVGDPRSDEDPVAKMLRQTQKFMADLQDIGVFG